MLKKAYEKQADKMLWDVWLARYPWMDEKSYISFEDFKKKSLEEAKQKPKEVPKTKKEIFTQAETIIKAWKKGGNKIGTV